MAIELSGDALIKSLECKHDIWEENKETWSELEDVLYDQVKVHKERYIQRGDDEDPADYQRRLKFARFKGELAPIINRFVGAAMSRPPTRPESLANKWKSFIANCDGAQTDLDEFNEDRLSEALGFGAAVVLIDKPTTDAKGFTTETTSMGFEVVTTPRRVDPQEIVAVPYRISQLTNWSIDRYGEFNWIRLHEVEQRSEDPHAKALKIDVYREFDRKSWRVYEVTNNDKTRTVELTARGDHDVGIVPIAILYLQKSKHVSFYSPMRYAYQHDITNFIADTDLQYILWKYGAPTIVDKAEEDQSNRVVVGPNARIRRSPANQEAVELLEMTGSSTEQIRKTQDAAQNGLRRIAGIDPLSGSVDPQAMNASGRSRALSFSISEERHLRRASKALTRYERRVFEIAERWVSDRKDISSREQINEQETIYPMVFSSAGTEGLIDQWSSTRTGINSETYDREMQVKIVDSALGDVGKEKRETILSEIEKNPIVGGAESMAMLQAAPMGSEEFGFEPSGDDEPEPAPSTAQAERTEESAR